MKYGHDYFHKELLLLQNLRYEDYRDKTELDVLIDKLNTEEIYAYYDVEWSDFSSQFINFESDWDHDRQFPCEIIVEDDKLEHVCSRIVDRGVKIKLLLFFQKNVQSVWIGYCNTNYIEKECARLISKNIRESVRDQYSGDFARMPRPNYSAMLVSENLFYEKTPVGKWIDSHLSGESKQNESAAELPSNVIAALSEFADECADASNYCPTKVVIEEAITRYQSYKTADEFKSDVWKYIHHIYDRLKAETGSSYWRQTPAYQVMAVLYILLRIQKQPSVSDASFARSIEKVIFGRQNFSCTKEMAEAVIQRIDGSKGKGAQHQENPSTSLPATVEDLPDMLSLVVRLIEVADEELERTRRENTYIYLSSVLNPYRSKLPDKIFDALEKIKKNKPVNKQELIQQVFNFNAPVGQVVAHTDKIVNSKEDNQ